MSQIFTTRSSGARCTQEMGKCTFISVITVIVLLMSFLCPGNSSILSSDSNQFGICIRNCAQCKKMFGAYFEGQLCADACVKFKGKIIPDCEDLDSISPFLNKVRLMVTMAEVKIPSQDVESTAEQEKGIDVSHWQNQIDWAKVAKAGIKHVFIKMSEGASYVDPRFVENWNGAKRAGIKVNCYHYFMIGCTPEQQMENIRNITKEVNFDPAKNALAIDVEEKGNEKATPVEMSDGLNNLLNLIKKDSNLSRRPAMIYTSYGYWDSKVKWEKYDFSAYPLWVAHYGVRAPRLPEPWKKNKTWAWWQHSSTETVDGIKGNVDADWVKV